MKTVKFLLAAVLFSVILSSCTEENVEPSRNGNVTTESNDRDKW